MDNFIDRIANRFSGHDAIKANSEAEAAEMRKLKSQAEQAQKVLAQCDVCMQEMRKLNLRNTESAKAVRELIENAQTVLNSMNDLELNGKEGNTNTDEIAAIINENFAAFTKQMAEADRKAAETAEKMNEMDGKLTAISEKAAIADEKLESLLNADSSLKADIENAVHKENVKVYRNVQASLMEEMSKQTDTMKEDFQRLHGFSKPLLILVIMSLLAGLGNLGILLAQMLGFL
jgi:DNA repair exonuclease SbcCD ATPase subunit